MVFSGDDNQVDPSAKPAQDFDESKHPRDERGRFADRGNADRSQNCDQRCCLEKSPASPERLHLCVSALACTAATSSIKRLLVPGPPTLPRRGLPDRMDFG
jgi:hypothetical protein